MGLTGFVIIHVFIASFSPAQGERNLMVNAKFTRPVNAMPMSTLNAGRGNATVDGQERRNLAINSHLQYPGWGKGGPKLVHIPGRNSIDVRR